MFGLSISELLLIGVVTLVAVGPQRLPGMLKTVGQWMRKLRKMTTEVRAQTGIDDLLRAEGLPGGLSELRTLVRGGPVATAPAPYRPPEDPYGNVDIDVFREYPPEGPDAKGALPDDLAPENEVVPEAETENVAPATEPVISETEPVVSETEPVVPVTEPVVPEAEAEAKNVVPETEAKNVVPEADAKSGT